MTDESYEIYVLVSDDYWYVGSASGKQPYAIRRYDEHQRGFQSAQKLQEVARSLGWGAFEMMVLEQSCGDHIAAESRWWKLGVLLETRECLNLRNPAQWSGTMTGRAFTAQHKKKISAALSRYEQEIRTSEERRRLASLGGLASYQAAVLRGDAQTRQSRAGMAGARKANARLAVCADCDMICRPSSMGGHLRKTGHKRIDELLATT